MARRKFRRNYIYFIGIFVLIAGVVLLCTCLIVQLIINKPSPIIRCRLGLSTCQHLNLSMNSLFIPSSSSLCSHKATVRGAGQKIVSYSLFLHGAGAKPKAAYIYSRYINYMWDNLKRIRANYPGWLMRIYTNVASDSGIFNSLTQEADFFVCNVTNLPILGNVSFMHPMVWRFLIIGDPTVSTFLARDLDSLIDSREASAVQAWEASTKIFHTMRDSEHHHYEIMGGLWGAKNDLLNLSSREALLKIFIEVPIATSQNDQTLLKQTLYTYFKKDFLIHDSYFCTKFQDSVPFPQQRTDLVFFVGAIFYGSDGRTVMECPEECRPSYGQDWIYC